MVSCCASQAFELLGTLIQVSPSADNKHNCDDFPAIASNADLIFKWLTVRSLDNNVQVCICISTFLCSTPAQSLYACWSGMSLAAPQSTNLLVVFLVSLLDVLRHNGYTMTDGEANILLPTLADRVRVPCRSPVKIIVNFSYRLLCRWETRNSGFVTVTGSHCDWCPTCTQPPRPFRTYLPASPPRTSALALSALTRCVECLYLEL